MTDYPKIEKRGFKFDMREEWLLLSSGFPQRGVWDEIPLTDADRKAHKRAKAALKELKKNPWVRWPWMEEDIYVDPLEPASRFTPGETREEWMARWEEAGCPDVHADQMRKLVEANILLAMKSATRTGWRR